MTLPLSEQNPLNKFKQYTAKHVIVAFRFSEDACSFDIPGNIGISGTVIPENLMAQSNCKGPGIVVINELQDSTFILHEAETTWEYYSEDKTTSGIYVGWLQVRDRVGMLFANQLRKYCEALGVALGHITFAWKTFFTGINENDQEEVVTTNPFIFHVTDFAQSMSAGIGRAYYMSIVSSYNTLGQLPQFSKMYQTTLTHADGNVSNDNPNASHLNGALANRSEEDQLKDAARKARMDKSKPMKTLEDVFNSLQTELSNQAIPNQAQIQDWQASIRDDYTKKIIPPKQFLPDLPIRYKINLNDRYKTYKVDNRNLPFEQPEQDQRMEGIRTIPFHLGTNLVTAVDSIMLLSRSVGKDYLEEVSTGYRSITTVLRGCEGNYNVTVNITPYTVPINTTDGEDTGPGDGLIGGPLEYFYQGADDSPKDIIAISYRSNVVPTQSNLEQETEGVDDTGVVYGNREPISIQRKPPNTDDFFAAGYTGNRGTIGIMDINGLESAGTASTIKSNLLIKQTTSYNITIKGNPWIMNDINRNPLDVRDNKGNGESGTRWNYMLYDKVECVPMYLKLSVYLRPDTDLAGDKYVDEKYFYTGYLHINKIVTYFGTGGNGFSQVIQAFRTEDSI